MLTPAPLPTSTRLAASARVSVDHYRLGVIDVTLVTNSRHVRRAYHGCYARHCVPAAGSQAVILTVMRRGSVWTRDRLFEISANGRERFRVSRLGDVVPHLDWACNWTIGHENNDFLQIHAASAALADAVAVFPGAPESGKTTLVAGLTLSGWSYLCDEFALIDPRSAEARPFPKNLCVKAGAVETLARLSPGIDLRLTCLGRQGGPVAALPARRLGHCSRIGGPVRLIVYPTFVPGAEATVRPISAAESLFRLNQNCINFLGFRERGIELLRRLVCGARSYLLSSGDLRQSIDLVTGLMRRPSSSTDNAPAAADSN